MWCVFTAQKHVLYGHNKAEKLDSEEDFDGLSGKRDSERERHLYCNIHFQVDDD